MNTNEPHDVSPFDEIPPAKRGAYIPVAKRVKDMTPDERANYLRNLRTKMVNVARASAVGQKVADGLQAVVSPLIDKLDEDATDEVNAPLLLGFLVGSRAWIGHFKGIEDEIVVALESCGISRDDYNSMCVMADAGGIQAVELVKKLIADEDAKAGA